MVYNLFRSSELGEIQNKTSVLAIWYNITKKETLIITDQEVIGNIITINIVFYDIF